jgi:hypothetical protein
MAVGKFGSVSNAVNPISKMTKSIATDDSLDIILLSLLPDFMVNSHRPKDTVLIGIGLPSTLCVAHEDLVRGLYLVDYFFLCMQYGRGTTYYAAREVGRMICCMGG